MEFKITLNIEYYLEEFAKNFIVTSDIGFPIHFDQNYPITYKTDFDWYEFSKQNIYEWLEDYFPDSNIYPEVKTTINNLVDIIYSHKETINNIAYEILNKVTDFNNNIDKENQKTITKLKEKYALGVYKATSRSKPITYKGVTYVSKLQCKILNNLSDYQLEKYLKENVEIY